jgi:hypothetical protein
MVADCKTRTRLRNALINYMAGEIRTFAFDECCSDCMDTDDRSIDELSSFLDVIYDDFTDHSISVSQQGWAVLKRIVAFLATDLEVAVKKGDFAWPFNDEEQRRAHEHLLEEVGLPD